MTSVFYSPAYALAKHEYSTTRKARWIAESLRKDPIHGIELLAPEPLAFEDVERIHDSAYVRAVQAGEPRDLAESQGFAWDPGLWKMVLASNGGVAAAASSAMKEGIAGSLSSGLHHAKKERGEGNCTFNGLAIAAKSAIIAGSKSVLIADLDAHCGGGTHSLIADDERIWQLDVSVSDFDSYDPTMRTTLDIVQSSNNYLPTIRRRFVDLEARGPMFDLCIYNAGMDPHEKCSVGGKSGIDNVMLAERERYVFEWCKRRSIPIAFVLAGGYLSTSLNKDDLVALHRLTISAAIA